MQHKDNSKLFLLFFTGLLVGFTPLTTDTYLPCFPELTRFFDTSPSLIQISLTVSMLGIALGPFFIGPLSDRYGRKPPLLFFLLIFCITTFGLIFSPNILVFIILRFLQGIASSAGMVVSRAILTDSFKGQELASSLSINTAIFGFVPASAPILGGILFTFTSWKVIFVFLLLIAIFVLFLCARFRESLPAERRKVTKEEDSQPVFKALAANRSYLRFAFIFSFSFAVTFVYIAASPFLFQIHFGLSPLAYSLLYGANAFASSTGSLAAARFRHQYTALKTGTAGAFLVMLLSAALLLTNAHIAAFQISLLCLFFFNGMTFPAATTLALEETRDYAGTASAMLGSGSFIIGGCLSPIVGMGNIVYSASIIMTLCAAVSLCLCYYPGKRR